MARFATAARLAAWAGLAPGDNESAGKRKKAPTRKGDQHLRAAMAEAAWATARTATRPGARFRRLARHYQQALTRLGYQVTLTPPGDGGPPPGTDPSTAVSSQTA